MIIPSLEVIFNSDLLDDTQSQQFRFILSESSLFQKFLRANHYIILEELDQSFIDWVIPEEDPAGQVEIQEGDKGRVLNFEVHSFENSPFGQLIVLLGEALFCITLVTIQIRNILVQLHSFACDDQSGTRPKLFVGIESLEPLKEIESKGESLFGEEELVTDGGEEQVSIFAEFSGLSDFGGGLAETAEVVAEVEVEGSGVFAGLHRIAFVAVHPAAPAFQVFRESVDTDTHFSALVHFSIKIIN